MYRKMRLGALVLITAGLLLVSSLTLTPAKEPPGWSSGYSGRMEPTRLSEKELLVL